MGTIIIDRSYTTVDVSRLIIRKLFDASMIQDYNIIFKNILHIFNKVHNYYYIYCNTRKILNIYVVLTNYYNIDVFCRLTLTIRLLQLCEEAQNWANHLAHTETFAYQNKINYGQNLFCRKPTTTEIEGKCFHRNTLSYGQGKINIFFPYFFN